MSTSGRKTWWQPTEGNGTIEFDLQTKRSYLELQHSPGQPYGVRTEGLLDDSCLNEGRPIGNPLEMDFTSKTRKLDYLSKRVGVDILHLGFVKISLEIIEEWREGLIGGGIEYLSQNGEKICQGTKEKTTLMQEECRSLLPRIELSSYATASKDDSAIMRQIAIEMRRDSSAMKAIALLGMFFLPGTFVTAIFAMPVFNWDEENVPVIKNRFKYCLAVALPLTLLVLVSWGAAMLFPWKKWISSLTGTSRAKGHGLELTEIGG